MILTEEASLQELPRIAEKIKNYLKTPCVVLLTGEMGAGKTTFVRAFAGEDASSASPTYSLIHTMGNIMHADLYRIELEQELDYLEISLYERCQYAFIEWGKSMIHTIKGEFGPSFAYYELKIDENFAKKHIRKYTVWEC